MLLPSTADLSCYAGRMTLPCAALVVLCLSSAPIQEGGAAHWPQFLGPGGAPRTDSQPTSLAFDLEQDVLWRAPLPAGASSPCIWEGRIFLTGHEEGRLIMLALDRTSGAELWRHSVEFTPPPFYGHSDASPAVPTACTDGERVIFYFGDWGLIARNLDGELLWEKPLPVPDDAIFGIGSSPILIDDMVILSRDGCPDSSIRAFAAEDGELLWQVPRLGFGYSFGTPYLWQNAERLELIVAGTQRLTALDPATGAELWRVTGLCSFVCTTPVGDAERLYFAAWSTGGAEGRELVESLFGDETFNAEQLADAAAAFARLDSDGDGKVTVEELPPCRAKSAFGVADDNHDGVWDLEEYVPLHNLPKGPGKNLMIAVAAGGKGDVTGSHVTWSRRRGLPYVASPLLHEGRIWLLKSGGFVTCLDPKTGEAHFDRERLDDRGEYYATAVGVPGHVIVASGDGTIYVLKSADAFELVTTVELGERIQATPAVVDGKVYVRTRTSLLAFGR
ncbi:MAG: hypothetical protein E2O39_00980 [Planctomycetota bacterium]|nr:MAG: hypothetical protein E2O39_00980 [Planctomycetota bacterium]